ncbi:uncharacterized protein LOC133815309 [Humulus lupulus]|uniref:uncharacterized protein LOC133815309 n=1 Tax=Humulus lupulus TaxID=3486 RepID=UPI002B41324E|nr:uncharacterized protein LOC133815309 [Humulus lupulus]
MAKARPILILFFFVVTLFFAAHAIQESRSEVLAPPYLEKVTKFSTTEPDDILTYQDSSKEKRKKNGPRRLMIGSTAPTCTYNECRGCRFKCRAEQVPVEGNDPINSAYHYRCVCHR